MKNWSKRSSYRQHHSQREQNDGHRGTKPRQCGDCSDCRSGQESRRTDCLSDGDIPHQPYLAIQAMRTAAETLYLKTKPYVGCQTLPQGQQIQKMRGLLSDITTSEMSAHITTLGLSAVVEELGTITVQYTTLIEQRSASQLTNKLDAGKAVRLELNEQYDDLVTIAFVTSVAIPSKEATDFVVYMNKLIADTETAYNQRIAQRGKKEETEKE